MKITYLTLALSITVGYFQGLNWKRYWHEGNGANVDRLVMMMGNMACFVICLGCLFCNWAIVNLAMVILPITWLRLYRPIIMDTLLKGKAYLSKVFHRERFP